MPELFIFVLSLGYTQNHTRGIYRGYYPTKNLCNFCGTPTPVPGASGSSVRLCHNTRNFWKICKTSILVPGTPGSFIQHLCPYLELLDVLYILGHNIRARVQHVLYLTGTSGSSLDYACATIPETSGRSVTPPYVPETSGSSVRPQYPYTEPTNSTEHDLAILCFNDFVRCRCDSFLEALPYLY